MNGRSRPLPADMLLVEERRRRLARTARDEPGLTIAGSIAADLTRAADAAAEELVTGEDDRLIGDDELLPDAASGVSAPPQTFEPGDVVLRRPVASVSLIHIAWGGPVDHDTLARAIACHPVDAGRAGILARSVESAPFIAAQPGAALEVTLHRADLALLERLLSSPAPDRALPLVRAGCLPERLTGAEVVTSAAVSGVLAAYRRAAVRHAWHALCARRDSPRINRERDESAVALLSTLRALLGER